MTTSPVLYPDTEPLGAVHIRLLGPLDIGEVTPTAGKVRRVLALLAVRQDQYVPVRDIARELWDEAPPKSWETTIQTYVMRLRAVNGLTIKTYKTQPCGYSLAVPAMDVDALRFMHYADQAARQFQTGDLLAAQDTLMAAFSLCRGKCLVDVDCGPLLTIWVDQFGEKRRAAASLRFEIELALGRHRAILDELRVEWRSDMGFEPTAQMLIVALYRMDRQRDALAVYQSTRSALMDEYGLEPGPGLRLLQQQILQGDPALELEAK